MLDNEKMIDSLRELVEINSVTRTEITAAEPFGKGPTAALDKALQICGELGFRTKNNANRTGWAEIGEGEEMVGILAHLDVVPEGDGWTVPPFALTRKDGKLFGRGTVDDKGPAVACIYAMKDLLDAKVKLNRRIRIIFGLSEEAGGWDDMEYYKQQEELPVFGITPDADYPAICGEKGILHFDLSMPLEKSGIEWAYAGTAANVVPEECRIRWRDANGFVREVRGVGKASHASLPEGGINAITAAVEQLEKEGVSSEFVRFYMRHIGWDLHGGKMGCAFEDEKSGKLTMNAGVLRAEEGRLVLSVDVRCPIDYTGEDVLRAVRSAADPYGITLTVKEWKPPIYIDRNGPVIRALLDTYCEMTGQEKAEAVTIGGGTYARAMDNIIAFGAAFPGKENREHMSDEYVLEEDFILNRKIYAKALERLANIVLNEK